MEKVYVVTKGCYSDYSICGVFSTKELAQAYIDVFVKRERHSWSNDFNDIEEYVLNSFSNDISAGYIPYIIKITRDGNCIEAREAESNYGFESDEESSIYNDILITHIFARDAEHAIKIANERRAMLIATNQWNSK